MKYRIFTVVLILFTHLTFAQEGKKEKSTIYFQGGYGTTVPMKYGDEYISSSLKEYESSTSNSNGFQLALGKKWKYVAVEIIYGDLGKTSVKYDGMFEVERGVSFVGGGFHWFLWIFELRLGWATYKGTRKFSVANSPVKPLEITPLDSKINSGGAYFGLGINFDLDSTTSVFFDSTAHVFGEKSVTYTVDGVSETFPGKDKLKEGDDKTKGTIGIATIGFRFSF